MEGITAAGLIALLGVLCSICSVASFYLGRKKALTEESERKGSLLTDIQYIKESLQKNTAATDKMAEKLEKMDSKQEKDYRDLLVKFTELNTHYESLEARLSRLEQK